MTFFTYNRNKVKRRTSLKNLLAAPVGGLIVVFILTAVLTGAGPGYHLTSASVHQFSDKISPETFVYMMGTENRHFNRTLPEDHEQPALAPLFFELAVNINPEDPRSFLGRELPGFSSFDGRILVAGEGADYTNMPFESAPPMEVLLAEREASTERLEELAKLKESVETSGNIEDLPVTVHIVHTHNRESFLPELQNSDEPFHESVNITLAGERLGIELAKHGIRADVNTDDITGELNARNWQYSQSYDMSREVIKNAASENEDIQFYFDIHRDSQPRELTTVEMNGTKYAQTLFVIGENNPDYERNKAFAAELHSRLQERYYGLSRGIFAPPVSEGSRNGTYNQDLSDNALLIEFGGIDNTLEEVYRSVELFAEVFSEYYWEQE